MTNFHICKVINESAYDLQDPIGHVRYASVVDIQLQMPAKYMLSDIKAFRWTCKYIA